MRKIKYQAFFNGYMWDVLQLNFSSGGIECELQREEGGAFPKVDTSTYDDVKLREYTGLKDKNGVEIYEGDVLQMPVTGNTDYHGEWCKNEVIKMQGQWLMSHISSEKGKLPRGYTRGFLLDHYEYDMKLFLWADDYSPHTKVEVIGNIYENPCGVDKE